MTTYEEIFESVVRVTNKPETVIADTPENRARFAAVAGDPIYGESVLEVPVQNAPVPTGFLEYAAEHNIVIRDERGTVHALPTPTDWGRPIDAVAYAYASAWNPTTGRPLAGHRWYTEDEARIAFDLGAGLDVVRVACKRDDGAVRAWWVIGIAPGEAPMVRVQWFTAGGSVVRMSDYDNLDGRLFRGRSISYEYPDDARRYYLFEAVRRESARFRPDGSLRAEQMVAAHGIDRFADETGQPVDGFWMDFPTFGDWELLGDVNYGF